MVEYVLKDKIMGDIEYFENYAERFKIIFPYTYADIAFLKCINLKYQYVTKGLVKHTQLDSLSNILGKTSNEINSLVPCELTNQWTQQDMLVKTTLTAKFFLEIAPSNGVNNIFVVCKTPIINPHTNNFVGIRGHLVNLITPIKPYVIKILRKMHSAKELLRRNKIKKIDLVKKYPLTVTQQVILYLAMSNYECAEISLLLNVFGQNVPKERVHDCLEQLKLIFNVPSTHQLIKKAIGLNYHSHLSNELFNKLCTIEISSEEAQTFLQRNSRLLISS